MYRLVNRKVHVACNFNCLIETEGLIKVIGRHSFIIKVVMCWKCYKIEMLLQTT